MKKSDKAWDLLEEKHNLVENINENGSYIITADGIRETCKRLDIPDVRNVVYMDTREKRPELFKKHGLSILPTGNGIFTIVKSDIYLDYSVPNLNNVENIIRPKGYPPKRFYNINSEADANNAACLSGMVAYFCGIDPKNLSTERKRLTQGNTKTPSYQFMINKICIIVNGVQVEIDAEYIEQFSENILHISEIKIIKSWAKNHKGNISTRQVLYPKLLIESEPDITARIHIMIYYQKDKLFRFIPYVYEYDNTIGYLDTQKEKLFKIIEPV